LAWGGEKGSRNISQKKREAPTCGREKEICRNRAKKDASGQDWCERKASYRAGEKRRRGKPVPCPEREKWREWPRGSEHGKKETCFFRKGWNAGRGGGTACTTNHSLPADGGGERGSGAPSRSQRGEERSVPPITGRRGK